MILARAEQNRIELCYEEPRNIVDFVGVAVISKLVQEGEESGTRTMEKNHLLETVAVLFFTL